MTEDEQIAFYYLPHLNPEGAFFPGVPLRDLTVAQVKELPTYIQKGIELAAFYVSSKAAAAVAASKSKNTGGTS